MLESIGRAILLRLGPIGGLATLPNAAATFMPPPQSQFFAPPELSLNPPEGSSTRSRVLIGFTRLSDGLEHVNGLERLR